MDSCNNCKHFKNNKRNNFNVECENVECKKDMFEIHEGHDNSGWTAWINTEKLKCNEYEKRKERKAQNENKQNNDFKQ